MLLGTFLAFSFIYFTFMYLITGSTKVAALIGAIIAGLLFTVLAYFFNKRPSAKELKITNNPSVRFLLMFIYAGCGGFTLNVLLWDYTTQYALLNGVIFGVLFATSFTIYIARKKKKEL